MADANFVRIGSEGRGAGVVVAPGVVVVNAAWEQQVHDFLTRSGRVVDASPVQWEGMKLWEIRFGFEPAKPMRAVWE